MTQHTANLRDSAYDFKRLVWPAIRDWCGGGDVYPVEGVTSVPFAALLDAYSGIDAWRVDHNARGLQGIASRVQYGAAYSSFTVRESRPSGVETELAKRRRALAQPGEHWAFPAFTVQAYLSEPRTGELLYVCMIRTQALVSFINKHHATLPRRTNPEDGSQFIVVWCEELLEAGITLWEHPSNGAASLAYHQEEVAEAAQAVERHPVQCYECFGQLIDPDWCHQCGTFQ